MAWTKAKTAVLTAAAVILAATSTTVIGIKLIKAHRAKLERALPGAFTRTGGNEEQFTAGLNFIKSLKMSGQLPGVSKDDHGMIIDGDTPETPLPGSYFLSSTLHFRTNESRPRHFYYVIVKQSRDSQWELKKAWRADSSRNVLEEYPIM